ncbi:hypothetical protein EVAR_4263_1 [Eumeta japonica]|uniref:Uncharacterized protein n=1 Tax=Eumeta variegata TaxID=151549 RepID=A0A4C1ZA38_EUMVA|nr:hypothetical protein EVAR_4263_1 [Eumeta japonica]
MLPRRFRKKKTLKKSSITSEAFHANATSLPAFAFIRPGLDLLQGAPTAAENRSGLSAPECVHLSLAISATQRQSRILVGFSSCGPIAPRPTGNVTVPQGTHVAYRSPD